MKLSIILLCWNDRKVIADCLQSIFANTHRIDFEVIVSDNGSTDGSIEYVRSAYPMVQLIENGRNLRFAKANNVGIRASHGEYVLILNPDTLIHEGCLDKIVSFADQHPEGGAFGCRVLNLDGSYQVSARPFASLRAEWIAALYLRSLGRLHKWFMSDSYSGWNGTTERQVDWVSGCFILVRAGLLKSIGGFDEQFFYYYEDMDLCRRIWRAGYKVLYSPMTSITHLGGKSTKARYPALGFALDGQVTRYLYHYKYSGERGVRFARYTELVALAIRRVGYSIAQVLRPTKVRRERLILLAQLFEWTYQLDPIRLVRTGEEPEFGLMIPNRVAER